MRDNIQLSCEFSECADLCHGINQLITHGALHIALMKDQLQKTATCFEEESDEVDNSLCECPWRGCGAVFDITGSNWSHFFWHIHFHVFHTYLKAIGDEELQKRNVSIQCGRDESQKNILPELTQVAVCRWAGCDYVADNPWSFYRHVDSHASNQNSSTLELRKCHWLSCNYSSTPTANVTKLKDHLRSHTQERRFACSRCGALYSSATSLIDHQNRESSGDKDFQCSHCSKKYANERLLRDHLRKHVNMYGCMFCEMTCPSPSALRVHILYRHSTERPFSCSECKKTFKTKFDLASHSITHEFKEQVVCCDVDGCGYRCKNLTTLHKHTKSVHSEIRLFGCHVCSDLFDNGNDLSKHLKCVHDIKYPPGHSKFRFAQEADGIRRLVTVRYECLTEDADDEERLEEIAEHEPCTVAQLAERYILSRVNVDQEESMTGKDVNAEKKETVRVVEINADEEAHMASMSYRS